MCEWNSQIIIIIYTIKPSTIQYKSGPEQKIYTWIVFFLCMLGQFETICKSKCGFVELNIYIYKLVSSLLAWRQWDYIAFVWKPLTLALSMYKCEQHVFEWTQPKINTISLLLRCRIKVIDESMTILCGLKIVSGQGCNFVLCFPWIGCQTK